MDANSRKKPSQLEINDLIAEAVVNAEARRNQAEELLSEEQAAAVKALGRIIPLGRIISLGKIFPIGKLMKPSTSSYSTGENLLES
jgi:predicted nucleic acid-binding protein